jgi:AcrR family transcriptional regulator
VSSASDIGERGPRRAALSRAALIDVAVTIARSEGLEALTMRRLAEATGKAPMTLYSHIPNKEGLLILVADTVLGQIEIPRGRWDRALSELSLSTWRTMGEVAGLATFVWKHVPYFFTPEGLRLADGSMGLLIKGGFEPADAGRALEALMTYITGDVQRHEAWLATARKPLARKVKGFPNLAAAATRKPAGRHSLTDTEEMFSYGLGLLLEGLRRDTRRRRLTAAEQRQQDHA